MWLLLAIRGRHPVVFAPADPIRWPIDPKYQCHQNKTENNSSKQPSR
jgi:hypothetical protein